MLDDRCLLQGRVINCHGHVFAHGHPAETWHDRSLQLMATLRKRREQLSVLSVHLKLYLWGLLKSEASCTELLMLNKQLAMSCDLTRLLKLTSAIAFAI